LLFEVREGVEGIPELVPPNFFDAEKPHIDGIGEPVTACFFTLATINPAKWLVSLLGNLSPLLTSE